MIKKICQQLIKGQPKQSLFWRSIPLNNYYSNQYLHPWQLNRKEFVELSIAINGSYTCRMIGELLKSNMKILTDYQLSLAMFQIWNHELVLDDYFYNTVCPILKEFIKKFDRECNKSLGEIIKYCGRLQVKDDGLWQLFEQKLLKENLVRYIPLDQLCKVAHAYSYSGKGSKELFQTFENIIIKHRLGLTQPMMVYARDAFTRNNLGSPILFQVLDNPTKDFPELSQQAAAPKQLTH